MVLNPKSIKKELKSLESNHQNLVDGLLAEGLPVLPVYLSSSIKMRESHEVSVPIIHLAPRHKLSREFFGLLDALERAA